MAITASGLYVVTLVNVLDTTQLALDLDLETHKIALFSNSVTSPDFTNDTAYGASPYDANEVTGTGWSAGGVALTGTTVTGASGVVTWDATDVEESGTTLTGARGGLVYADALSDQAIVLVNFADDFNTVNGTFKIAFNAAGIFTFDLTP
jgi:hypothetical protein